MTKTHDHNGVYTHKEVCTEIRNGIDNKFSVQQYQINDNRADIKSFRLKINATLIGIIGILISVVFLYLKP